MLPYGVPFDSLSFLYLTSGHFFDFKNLLGLSLFLALRFFILTDDGMDGWMGWMDGWMDGMVIIGHRCSKSTFGAYNLIFSMYIYKCVQEQCVISRESQDFFNFWQRALMLQRITRSKSHC